MLTVLDIGARGGPDPRWRVLSPEVNVVGVDADAEECVRLNRMTFDVPCRFVSAALGSRDGEAATLHLTRQPGCSSLLEPNHAYLAQFPYGREAFQVVRRIPLTLTRLDTLCLQHAITADVIKIDTQGSELDILRGGEAALQRASLIELEVEFNPLYADQPLFGDLDTYLRMRGFNLLGLRRTAWRRNQNGSLGGDRCARRCTLDQGCHPGRGANSRRGCTGRLPPARPGARAGTRGRQDESVVARAAPHRSPYRAVAPPAATRVDRSQPAGRRS